MLVRVGRKGLVSFRNANGAGSATLPQPFFRSHCVPGVFRFPSRGQVTNLSSLARFPRGEHRAGLHRSRVVLQRLRKMCTAKPDPESAEAAEEGIKRSIPQLLLGMGAGVAGSWLGLGMFGGAIMLAGQLGDNAFAGRLQALLILGTFIFPPVVGAVAFTYVIQMEWSIAYFFGPAVVFYGIPCYTFLQMIKSRTNAKSDNTGKFIRRMNASLNDMQQLHVATAALCDKMNSAAVGVDDDEAPWGSQGGFGSSSSFGGSSFGGSSSSFGDSSRFGESNVIVRPDNFESLQKVLREVFNLGVSDNTVLTKKEFYRAMNSSGVAPEQKELLMFFNRVTKWGMKREIGFREFAFTMMFYIARSEDNVVSFQESMFKFFDTKAMASIGADELAEVIELTNDHFGQTVESKFTFMGYQEKTALDQAEDILESNGKMKNHRLDMEEFKIVMTDMGYEL